MLTIFIIAMAATVISAATANAEEAMYGEIYLGGLDRDVSWPLNPPGKVQTMVCNVNGPDGYLSVRMGPGTDHPDMRSFKRLAILEVDTRERHGHWIRVWGAMRTHTVNGISQEYKQLPVTGWAHDGYLCAFQD